MIGGPSPLQGHPGGFVHWRSPGVGCGCRRLRAPSLSAAGEVGIEFMVVRDGSGPRAMTYQVPLTYRAGALAAAADGLIGTAEHGVLGRRWVYDGTCDPVLVAELVALVHGQADAQAQGVSDTRDPAVIGWPVADGPVAVAGSVIVANGPAGTEFRVQTAGADGIRVPFSCL